MSTHFTNHITFAVQPDGTTHIRFMYLDPSDSKLPPVTLCTMVMPNELALQLSTMIAKGVTVTKELTQPSKKSKN